MFHCSHPAVNAEQLTVQTQHQQPMRTRNNSWNTLSTYRPPVRRHPPPTPMNAHENTQLLSESSDWSASPRGAPTYWQFRYRNMNSAGNAWSSPSSSSECSNCAPHRHNHARRAHNRRRRADSAPPPANNTLHTTNHPATSVTRARTTNQLLLATNISVQKLRRTPSSTTPVCRCAARTRCL